MTASADYPSATFFDTIFEGVRMLRITTLKMCVRASSDDEDRFQKLRIQDVAKKNTPVENSITFFRIPCFLPQGRFQQTLKFEYLEIMFSKFNNATSHKQLTKNLLSF